MLLKVSDPSGSRSGFKIMSSVEMGNIEQVINFKVKLKILRDVL
jgi:hypothetical protein